MTDFYPTAQEAADAIDELARLQANDNPAVETLQRPYLHLGAGRIILPGPKPAHHGLIPEAVYSYPLWHNVDRNAEPGIDQCIDLFQYPWPLADNAYNGALLTHLCEHIPHEIKPNWAVSGGINDDMTDRFHELEQCQDGWFAFFAELYRVLTPGALVYILSPYAWSAGGITDPTHTRYLTPATFQHSMTPNPDAPFAYAVGGLHFEIADTPRCAVHQDYAHLAQPGSEMLLQRAMEHDINVCYEFALTLRAVK